MSFKYVAVVALAVLFTFFFHEASHWLAGELLGNDMGMNLNAAFPRSGKYLDPSHEGYVTAAGPIFTIAQALAVHFWMRRNPTIFLYPFLLTPLIMRMLAMGMNFVNPQDEGRISQSLGIGTFTIPVLVCALLFVLTRKTSRRGSYSMKFNALSTVFVVLFSSVLILGNQYVVSAWK